MVLLKEPYGGLIPRKHIEHYSKTALISSNSRYTG